MHPNANAEPFLLLNTFFSPSVSLQFSKGFESVLHMTFSKTKGKHRKPVIFTQSFHRLNCIYMLMKLHRYGEPPTTKQKIWVKVICNKIRKGKKGSKLDRAKLDPAPFTKTWWKPSLKGSLSELLPQYPRAISPETQKSSVLSKARLGRG